MERENYLSLKSMVISWIGNLFVDDMICRSVVALGSGHNVIAVTEELNIGCQTVLPSFPHLIKVTRGCFFAKCVPLSEFETIRVMDPYEMLTASNYIIPQFHMVGQPFLIERHRAGHVPMETQIPLRGNKQMNVRNTVVHTDYYA